MIGWLASLTPWGWFVASCLLILVAVNAGLVWDYERERAYSRALAKRITALEQHITPTEPTGRHAKGQR